MLRYLLPVIVLLVPAFTSTVDPYADFVAETQALTITAEAFRRGEVGILELRAAVSRARLVYKRIAWRVEFSYPGFVAKHLNGAPLLKAEKYGTHSTVQPPEGLQLLDEMAYAAEVDAVQFSIRARALANAARQLSDQVSGDRLPTTELVEALRTELIRIPTLYLTGFDTPGSAAGLEESRAALRGMREILKGENSLADYAAYPVLLQRLSEAESALVGQSFEDLDRLAYQRDHLNPLFATLGLLGGSGAASLYAEDFLDPYAYTILTPETDNEALRQLGMELFYDTRLSADGSLSCASCHRPELAFTDGGNNPTARNSPTLLNAVYADRFFYDLRAFTLEQQAEHVIFDRGEFNTDYPALLAKVRADVGYRRQFRDAFGKRDIDRDGFSAALTSYVLSLRSLASPFDRYARGETDWLDPAARYGYNLFMGKAGCGSCHFAPTFSGLVPPYYTENESEILGVLASPYQLVKALDSDRGRAASGIRHDDVWIFERSFKTPTVRNVALTAPYFHNGAYATLEQVVDFYDHGGGEGLGLYVPNQTLPSDSLHLSDAEKAALVAFMKSLSDLGAAAGAR